MTIDFIPNSPKIKTLSSGDSSTFPELGGKSLRNPLFEETSDRAIRLAHRRKRTTVATIVGVIILIAGIFGFNKFQDLENKKIVTEFLKVETKYTEELKQFQEASSKNPTLQLTSPKHEKSLPLFVAFAKSFENHPLALQALLKVIAIKVDSGQTQDVLPFLDTAIQKSLKNNLIQIRLRKIRAGVLADQNNFDEAVKELVFTEKIPDNPITGELKLLRGRFLFAADKKEEAAKVFNELIQTPAADSDVGGRSLATEASLWLKYYQL